MNEVHMLVIKSLGRSTLTRNGQRVRLNAGMSMAVETLSYFIRHEAQSVDAVINDVFAHLQPEAARGYFHLIRFEIANNTALRIRHDKFTKKYRLDSHEPMSWDLQNFTNCIRNGLILPDAYDLFLPTSTSAWVELERQKLENDFVAASIARLNKLETLGALEDQHLLLEHLLHLFPMNAQILEFSVRYTARTFGRQAAKIQLESIKNRFQVTGIPMPETLGACITLH
jgi:DNA-binding SARP family transcriptional activator